MVILILIFAYYNTAKTKLSHMSLHSFNRTRDTSFFKISLYLNSTVTPLRFVIVIFNFITKFVVINFSLRYNMINYGIISTARKLKYLAHLFNSIIIKISLNKGHVLSY